MREAAAVGALHETRRDRAASIPAQRLKPMICVGYMAYSECPESGKWFEKPADLAESYEQALWDCLPLLAETLLCEHNAEETRPGSGSYVAARRISYRPGNTNPHPGRSSPLVASGARIT